jgi:hypothetical protein
LGIQFNLILSESGKEGGDNILIGSPTDGAQGSGGSCTQALLANPRLAAVAVSPLGFEKEH